MGLDATKTKSESDVQGFPRPEPGRYLAVIKNQEWKQPGGKTALAVEFETIAGTVPGQSGRTVDQKFFLSDDNDYQPSHLRLGLATGLVQPGTVAEDPNWAQIVGAFIVIGVEKKSGKDNKEYTNIGNWGLDIWGTSNPDVADVMSIPDVRDAVARINGQAAPAAQAPAPTAVPQQTQPAQQPAPATAPQQQAVSQPVAANAWGNV